VSEIEREDIKAMRQEGGGAELRAFMRAQIAIGRSRRTPGSDPPPLPLPGRPGEWPTTAHDTRFCPICNPRSTS
jgi:hypothetical protein